MYVGGGSSAPALCDIDGDNDYDLFSGSGDSTLRFWRNISNYTGYSFQFVTNAYAGLTNNSVQCMPEFVDIDADGDFDLFVGALDGKVTFYQNTGSVANAEWATPVLNYVSVSGRSAPAFCNIDFDRNGAGCWTNDSLPPLSFINGTATKATIGLNSIETGYAKDSVYRSGVFDTRMTAPQYNQLNWTHVENKAQGWDVDVRIRSSTYYRAQDMTELDWLDANGANSGYFDFNTANSLVTLPKRRYVQYEVRLKCNENNTNPSAHTNDYPGAILRDVTIDWPGQTGLVDLLIDFGKGPDCGIINAKVNGETFVKGVKVDMSIFKAGRLGTNSVSGSLEIRPLNTGK
jgi:hypothetical protein